MDIKKLKEEIAKLPPMKDRFIGQKKPVPVTPIIHEIAKKLGIPVKEYGLPDIKNFPDVVGLPVFNNENEER